MELEQGQSQPNTAASRRQALNACDACRQRKTKCDEAKPSCGRCSRLRLACSYVETITSKRNLSLVELTSTLTRMERKIDTLMTNNVQNEDQERTGTFTNHNHYTTNLLSVPDQFPRSVTSPPIPMETYFAPSNFEFPQHPGEQALSERHSTAPQHLLSWPCSTVNMSKTELNYSISLEIKRPKLPKTHAPPLLLSSVSDEKWLSHLSLHQVRQLCRLYFSHFHAPYLLVDETHFYNHHLTTALREEFRPCIEGAITLFVLSLGSIAAYHTGAKEWAQSNFDGDQSQVGLGLFTMACEVFEEVEGTDWMSTQCLLLKGMFYASKLRIHDSWKMIHRACSTIMILLPLQDVLDAHQCQLYWVAYLHESQILAEYDFPPSGLGIHASAIPLPLVPDLSEDTHREYQFFFLAHIAMRRLLNRIHFHLFSRKSEEDGATGTKPIMTSESDKLLYTSQSVISELNRQLEEWRACLPAGLQFPPYSFTQENHDLGPYHFKDVQQRLKGHLMARYFAAKSIIHRPFVYRALHSGPNPVLTEADQMNAKVAIDSAILSVKHSGLLHEPMPLLLHPINSCRSFFALALQFAFISRSNDACELMSPDTGQFIQGIKDRITEAASVCPTVAKDMEILDTLI